MRAVADPLVPCARSSPRPYTSPPPGLPPLPPLPPLQVLLNFLIILFVVFFAIVLPMNALYKMVYPVTAIKKRPDGCEFCKFADVSTPGRGTGGGLFGGAAAALGASALAIPLSLYC